MPIDRARVFAIFEALGARLTQPTTLCLIGSTPAILLGQHERQTQDIDVWHPASQYDAGELARICGEIGILFDPTGSLDPDAIYLQIMRPGIVSLPADVAVEVVARFGSLTVAMLPPALIAARKLTRGDDRDVEDIVWWVRQRALNMADVADAIEMLPREIDRETARDNMVLIKLVASGGKP
jgi:hypothetical protein